MKTTNKTNEQYYIVRANGAGVFFTQIKERKMIEGTLSLVLTNTQHIYNWNGAINTTEIAVNGVSSAKISNIAQEVEVFNILQINKCSDIATQKIKAIPPYRN